MTVQGRDCLIVIKTHYREMGVPYAEETIADERTATGEAVKVYIWHEGGG
jgi:hypothetical protein